MKSLTIILSLVIVCAAIAEEPAALVELRQGWEKQRTEAQAKVDELYFAELEGLKQNFTKADNIAAALVVDNAIKGGKEAENEPAPLTKTRVARNKSLEKALKPLDKQYWQNLKTLRKDFQKQGNLAGVVAADAEIKKVLAAYKKPEAKPKLNRKTVAVIEQQGWAGAKNHPRTIRSNNIYEFELEEDVKGAVVKMWVGSHVNVADKTTINSNGVVTVIEPDGKKTIAYQWTSEKLEQASNNSVNPKFKDAYLIEFDAEKTIKAKGNYKIDFSYKSGAHGLGIEKVEVLAFPM